MTEPNPPTAPLTAEDVDRRVRDVMMAQQTQLLEIAGRNTLKLLQEEQKKAKPSLVDTINLEVEAAREYDSHDWKTPINKENFNCRYQVEQLGKRTERLVDAMELPEDQAVLKATALEAIEKGKNIVHERLKVIRYADRDGWKAALHFLGDNIAESEAEAKRMSKSKKETDKEKEAEKARRERETHRDRGNRGDGQGSSRDREPWGRYGQSSSYSNGYGYQTKLCYHCNRTGHIARFCPHR